MVTRRHSLACSLNREFEEDLTGGNKLFGLQGSARRNACGICTIFPSELSLTIDISSSSMVLVGPILLFDRFIMVDGWNSVAFSDGFFLILCRNEVKLIGPPGFYVTPIL